MHTIFDGTIRAFRVRCSLARSGFSVNSAVQRGEPLWESAAATSAAFLSGYNIYTYMANLSTSDGIRCRIVCASECECVHVWVCVCVFVNTHNFAVKRSKLWVRVCASVHKFCVLLSNYVIECTVCFFYEQIGESRQTTRGEWQHKQHRSSPPQPCSGIPLICDDEPMFTDFVIVSLSNLIGFVSPFVCGGVGQYARFLSDEWLHPVFLIWVFSIFLVARFIYIYNQPERKQHWTSWITNKNSRVAVPANSTTSHRVEYKVRQGSNELKWANMLTISVRERSHCSGFCSGFHMWPHTM